MGTVYVIRDALKGDYMTADGGPSMWHPSPSRAQTYSNIMDAVFVSDAIASCIPGRLPAVVPLEKKARGYDK